MSYYEKYLKYKNKYLELRKQIGGKIEWKYTHKQEPQLDQDLVEREYQTWISLGKPDNYSSNEVRFPLYTFNGNTIMRTSDQASDVPVDEDCNSCKLRLASYKKNWKNDAYKPPGEIYSIYFDHDDYEFVESNFLKDVKKNGGCIKCIARANELIDKKASEEAFRKRLGFAPAPAPAPAPAHILPQYTHYPSRQWIHYRGQGAAIAL
jgi:hypothetical protein